jgi:precorrin-6B methylase 2
MPDSLITLSTYHPINSSTNTLCSPSDKTNTEVTDLKILPFRSRTTLPAIIFFTLLLPLAPLPACTGAFAYMDTERSHKLDAPFVRTPDYVIAEILHKAGVVKDDILYDLGSGDGRIVIEAAGKTGCRAVGIEIDAELVDDSRLNAARAGVQDRVRFVVADLFKEDLSEATVVTIYMSGDVNRRLRPKLLRELKPGTRIATYTFDMGEWKPDNATSFGREDAYFWVVPANASGKWAWTEGKGRSRVRWEMELKQVFQEFSGQISRNGRLFPLRDGKIKGDEIRFSLDGDPADKPSTLVFTGRIRGNTIEGTIAAETARRAWKAARNPATMLRIDR